MHKLRLSVSLNLYKHVVFPEALNKGTIDGFEPAFSLEGVALTEALELLAISKENMTLSWFLIFFEVTIILEPEVINVG